VSLLIRTAGAEKNLVDQVQGEAPAHYGGSPVRPRTIRVGSLLYKQDLALQPHFMSFQQLGARSLSRFPPSSIKKLR